MYTSFYILFTLLYTMYLYIVNTQFWIKKPYQLWTKLSYTGECQVNTFFPKFKFYNILFLIENLLKTKITPNLKSNSFWEPIILFD